ncbi:helix-turn-helix domain-containing protein [Streptomyces katrae]|uniref:helix-turn-helix domain-containing protein n=1 Tax=Streptomyces katrae TaxID=68223 RepID=UPI00133185D6|nr:helix-turn-helix domain-containing protein [Streptomyces katrae]
MAGLSGSGIEGQRRPEVLAGLLKAARVGPGGHRAAAHRVAAWLGRAVGGSARIEVPARIEDSARAGGWAGAGGGDGALLRDVAAGSPRSAVVAEPGRHLRVLALGVERPHPVLVVTRPSPYDEAAAALVAHAATVLELLLSAGEADERRRRLAEAGAGVRLSVLQLLMGGEVVLAQRTMAGLRPGLLDAERVVVCVLEASEGERGEVARACEGLLAGRALVVRCPADDGHVIVVAPVTPGGAAGTGAQDALREFVTGRDGVFLGVGDRHPISRVAAGYDDAIRSLAAARLMPGRVAGHQPGARLPEVLDAGAAAGWAAGFLRPLAAVPAQDRGQLTATVRLGLEFTAVNAARLLGISRNTVRARMDRVAGLLGLDLGDVRARAALDLALRLDDGDPGTARSGRAGGTGQARKGGDGGHAAHAAQAADGSGTGHARPAATRPGPGPGPGPGGGELGRMLAAPPVLVWARDLLAPLRGDERDLRRTLRDWVGENCAVEPAARRRGVHPQTVREHLRGAEGLLRRQLVAGGSGLYEVVLALTVTGELDEAPSRGSSGRSAPGDRALVTPSCPATVHP